jgi:hypothetical protein
MKTIHKGAIAQLKVELRAAERGFVLSKPCVDVRYDYILDDGRRLEKVQVKYGGGSVSRSSGVVAVSLRGWKGKEYSRVYCEDEVDALLVYVPKIDKILKFSAPLFCGKANLYVRLEPALNSQVKGTLLAQDYLW